MACGALPVFARRRFSGERERREAPACEHGERNFGLLKNHYGLTPLRTRGREGVALHADLTMLARLSQALARARAVTLAA